MEDLNANRFFQNRPYEISWPYPPIIITDHLKTPENLGQIIRLAGNVGCAKVLAVHEGESLKLSKVQKMANVAGEVVEWHFCKKEEVLNRIATYNTIITDEEKLKNEWDNYINAKYDMYLNYCSPFSFISNRYVRGVLNRLGIKGLNKRGIALAHNLMRCEAHLDMSKEVTEKYLKR